MGNETDSDMVYGHHHGIMRCSPKIGQVIKFKGKGEHKYGKEKEVYITI